VLRRSAFIVAPHGVSVEFNQDSRSFVSRRGGTVVPWREIRPGPLAGTLGGRLVRVENGVIVAGDLSEQDAAAERAGALAAYVRNGRRRADVVTIAASGLSWLEG
jgi:hypothetical protein